MKHFLFFAGFLIFTIPSIAQDLTVTSLKVSDNQRYQEMAGKLLGKTMSLTFFDNSVRVTINGQKKALVLSKYDESNYQFFDETEYRRTSYRLKVNTTMMVISSVEFSANFEKAVLGSGSYAKPTGQWKFIESFSVIAKRF